MEHALAVSETERCRCFLLYGDVAGGGGDRGADRETEAKGGGGRDGDDDGDHEDDAEEDDFAITAARRAGKKKKLEEEETGAERSYRLVSVILAEETKVMPGDARYPREESDRASDVTSQTIQSPRRYESSSSPPLSSSSPLDILRASGGGSEDDRTSRLLESLDRENKRVRDGEAGVDGSTRMERHPLGMFGLVSGVWLGDAFVREGIPPSLSRARAMRDYRRRIGGFGKGGAAAGDGDGATIEEDRFAVWHLGAQKVALRFEWDYRDGVSQSYTYGRVMGTPTSLSCMANIKSDGVVVLNESKRRASTKEREGGRAVWDMDGGAYVSGLVGSRYFRAPRYMSFTRSRGYTADAYLTEFMVFYRPEGKDPGASPFSGSDGGAEGKDLGASTDEVDGGGPEYYCSRTSRLYDAKDGSLMQGSTAFFSLSRHLRGSENLK